MKALLQNERVRRKAQEALGFAFLSITGFWKSWDQRGLGVWGDTIERIILLDGWGAL